MERTPEELATCWFFYRRGARATYELQQARETFEELLRLGCQAELIEAEIKRPKRRRTEPIWELEKRLVKFTTDKPAAPSEQAIMSSLEPDFPHGGIMTLEESAQWVRYYVSKVLRPEQNFDFVLAWRREIVHFPFAVLQLAVDDLLVDARRRDPKWPGHWPQNHLAFIIEHARFRQGQLKKSASSDVIKEIQSRPADPPLPGWSMKEAARRIQEAKEKGVGAVEALDDYKRELIEASKIKNEADE